MWSRIACELPSIAQPCCSFDPRLDSLWAFSPSSSLRLQCQLDPSGEAPPLISAMQHNFPSSDQDRCSWKCSLRSDWSHCAPGPVCSPNSTWKTSTGTQILLSALNPGQGSPHWARLSPPCTIYLCLYLQYKTSQKIWNYHLVYNEGIQIGNILVNKT